MSFVTIFLRLKALECTWEDNCEQFEHIFRILELLRYIEALHEFLDML